MAIENGACLGAYRIIRTIGEGGMGRVYEAEHAGLRVRRALKVFSAQSEQSDLLRKRFVAEGRILADLQHPRIVRVYDFAIDGVTGVPYFAMDLVLSPLGVPRTLEEACREGVSEEQVAGWFRDICEGLSYIHGKGVVHRDVSLDNILIDRDGHAVLTDFGIAKITGADYRRKLDVTLTLPLSAGEALRWGKGLYLSPEMKLGFQATPASDAYAVGVLLFRLLAGSWYTPETRLDDALAGLDYNWSEVIAGLCAEKACARLPPEGIRAVPNRLRRTSRPSAGFPRAWRMALAGVLAFALALGAFVWRRQELKSDRAHGDIPPGMTNVFYQVVELSTNANYRAVCKVSYSSPEKGEEMENLVNSLLAAYLTEYWKKTPEEVVDAFVTGDIRDELDGFQEWIKPTLKGLETCSGESFPNLKVFSVSIYAVDDLKRDVSDARK